MKAQHINYNVFTVAVFILTIAAGCKKFMDTPLPTDRLTADGVYLNDASAGASLTGILSNISSTISGNAAESVAFRTALYADELQLISPAGSPSSNYIANALFYNNALTSANSIQWAYLYKQLYFANLAIEGVTDNQDKLPNKNQWLGEALFLRALLNFDLVNLFGDVPLATTPNYLVNNVSKRTSKAVVVSQMIEDLKQAQRLLGTAYLDGLSAVTVNRARPNQNAATALLARIYLYDGQWTNAELEASKVIGNTASYELVAPASAFLANSRETIWALAPVTNSGASYVRDYDLYNRGMAAVVANQSTMAAMVMTPISLALQNSFETGDTRFNSWLRLTTTTTAPVGGKFYFPNKYKSNVIGTEFIIILRIGEQYLIRAEARARQNDLSGARSDLNAIRTRAGLAGTLANSQSEFIEAIIKERRVELFSESGHRFYDLKRTGTIDGVMNVAAPLKGGGWSSFKQIWPIPASDMLVNPNLIQSPGYN